VKQVLLNFGIPPRCIPYIINHTDVVSVFPFAMPVVFTLPSCLEWSMCNQLPYNRTKVPNSGTEMLPNNTKMN
jgi:hypothetical protein